MFIVGPVLSFRGVKEDGQWCVSALIGIESQAPSPIFNVDGNRCPAPAVLLEHQSKRYLRYDLTCEMHDQERRVSYGVENDGPTWEFTIPGKGYAPRMAYVSCNGFSDSCGMRKLVRPENTVWADLIVNHDKKLRPRGYKLDKEQLWHEERIHDKKFQRFHLLLMGGDQIYFDSIWSDIPELKQWVGLSRNDQLNFSVNLELEQTITNYYFGLYSERWLPDARRDWGSRALPLDVADAMARIPTVMMWDDHDIFDGWGSYSKEMQNCELFIKIFQCARKAFWVFQMQHAIENLPPLKVVSRKDVSDQDPQLQPISWQTHQQHDALALPILHDQAGFTFLHQIGPVSLVVADLRTERSRTQVMGASTWKSLRTVLNSLEEGPPAHPGTKCQHLILLSSVPVVHPKLSLIEGLMDAFGQDHVLDSNADDLRDHWAHDDHEGERKRLLETLIEIAGKKSLRVSIVSGDVHVAAWGTAYRKDLPLTANWAKIQQFTSSAIVHPSLVGVAERLFSHVLNGAAKDVQRVDVELHVEMMLFPGFNRYIMPSRNWLALELDMGGVEGAKLWATWRCETEAGFSNHLQAVSPANCL